MQHRIRRITCIGLTLISLLLIHGIPSNASDALTQAVSARHPQVGTAALGQRLLVQADDHAQIATLIHEGATLIVDYGASQLWRRPVSVARAADSLPTNLDLIRLRGRTIDTRTSDIASTTSAPQSNRLSQQRSLANQLWLVQFVGPPQDEWLSALRDIGLTLVGFVPHNSYVVWGNGDGLDKLDALTLQSNVVQWAGPFHPEYRLAPKLRPLATGANIVPVEVNVQLYHSSDADIAQALAEIATHAVGAVGTPTRFRHSTIVRMKTTTDQLATLATMHNVLNIEPWVAPHLRDERQGQLMAGNIHIVGGNTVPTGPGYVNWLTAQGVSMSPGDYPVVAVVDDGVDIDQATSVTPDFYVQGNPLAADRRVFIRNCSGDEKGSGLAGHGTLNAGIMAGYNNTTNPVADSAGYRYGMGIAPFMTFGSTKIFKDAGEFDISRCGSTMSDVVISSYLAGARITSNSWGAADDGLYTLDSAQYDALTRDADGDNTNGNQQMLHVFAAGNEGGNGGLAYTIDSPGTAKNVLTVGATEGVRDGGVKDGCSEVNADDANDMAPFSSRGPTNDGRIKPDLVAPGTHIIGPALPPDTGWTGTSVCGMPNSRYYPANQFHYTWSSGTSHSTPAVSGAAALAYEYYKRALNPGKDPSPAMLKALLLNTPRYIDGVGAGGTLPSPSQGWGTVNLSALYTDTTRRVMDQEWNFHQPGQTYVTTGNIVSSTRPFRVTLAWTDAPGEPYADPYGNDLDLKVQVGGQTYFGNVFSGANSVASAPNGQTDFRNNIENVFLPAGVSGSYTITVTGYPFMDGVPNVNADESDQDFALVVMNGTALKPGPAPEGELEWTDAAFVNSRGGTLENGIEPLLLPGDRVTMVVTMTNASGVTAQGIGTVLVAQTNDVSVVAANASIADLASGASGQSQTPFVFDVSPAATCGNARFALTTTYTSGLQTYVITNPLTLSIGHGFAITPTILFTTSHASGLVIPDNREAGVVSTLTLPDTGASIGEMRIRINRLDHTYTSDLRLRLIAPSGRSALLISRRGDTGDHFRDLTLDDASEIGLLALTPPGPYTGVYFPETPLNLFVGERARGDWKLVLQDVSAGDTGRLFSWTMILREYAPICTLPPPPTATPTPTSTPSPTPLPTQTATPTPPSVCAPVTVVPNVAIPDNKPDLTCVDIPVSDIGKVTDAAVRVGMTHTWVSDLRFVLQSPDGKVLTLMNRPGFPTARNGHASDLQARYPITFSQNASNDAERMGSTTSSQVICRDDGKCSYLPNADSDISATINSLAGFANSPSNGTWKFCVNDNFVGDVGRLASVRLDLTCVAAATATPGPSPTPTATPSPTPIGDYCAPVANAPNVTIPDNVAVPNCFDLPVTDAGTVTSATVRLALSHTYISDLKVQLRSPSSVTLTLLNRPGIPATAFGDSSDLNVAYPITFVQSSPNDAEKMGNTIGGTGIACRDDRRCSYFPNPNGDFGSVASFAGVVGQSSVGTWRVCVNDLAAKDTGKLASAMLDLACSAPSLAPTPTAMPTIAPALEPTATNAPPSQSLDKPEEPDYKYDVWMPVLIQGE